MKYKPLTQEEKKEKEAQRIKKTADLFIKALEENKAPWQKPWNPNYDVDDYNPTTDKYLPDNEKGYHGWNSIVLQLTREFILNSEDPRWCTMLQVQEMNKGKEKEDWIWVKKGEEATPISRYIETFFDKDGKPIKEKENLTKENIAFHKSTPKTFFVFNYSQLIKYKKNENGETEMVPAFDPPSKNYREVKENIKAEEIIKKTKVKIFNDKKDECYYSPMEDAIHMVRSEFFKTDKEYYGTLLHELTHWTGNPERLDRETSKRYGESKEWRAKEELVAEIGSYLLAKSCKINFEPTQNNKSYVQSWCNILKEKPESIMESTAEAVKASKFITNLVKENSNVKTNINDNENKIIIKKETSNHR